MKNIIFIAIVFCFNLSNAQTPIVALEDKDGTRVSGTYYKDVNNVIDDYEGTWLYTDPFTNTSLKIVLVKKTMVLFGDYYEDLIVGECQYIENGTEKLNTLSNLNLDLHRRHSISGNNVLTSPFLLDCTDCEPGEKRLQIGISDELAQRSGPVVLKKTVSRGQEAIKMHISYYMKASRNGSVVNPGTIPGGWYILVKQP